MEVNTLAPIVLFQDVLSRLAGAEGEGEGEGDGKGKFVLISSVLGSMEVGKGGGSYGISKAGVNFAVRRMGEEEKGVVCLVVHPGFVFFFSCLTERERERKGGRGLIISV